MGLGDLVQAIIGRFRPARAAAMPDSSHLVLGRQGERLAERYLRGLGYRLVTRNYRCPGGEIDLVALDGRTLVFIEVKTRRDDIHADPQDAVHGAKRQRFLAAVRSFLQTTDALDRSLRCDILAIICPAQGRPRLRHIVDAFRPGDGWSPGGPRHSGGANRRVAHP